MSIEAMKQALEALETLARYENPETRVQVRKPKDGGPIVTMYPHKVAIDAANALRTVIADAEKQEPVAFAAEIVADVNGTLSTRWADWWTPNEGDKLYTTPPAAQRPWVGLTDAEIAEWDYDVRDVVMDIEKLLRDKNT
jgi:hypothetical protein